ncbi:MAG: glycerol-3-phosphate 1-O-acyltransferase PlsY [Rickettsiales bacterium]
MFYCLSNVSFILILTSYMLGSVPFGLLLTKAMGFGDVRKYGSGNIGATNVLRRTGKLGGLITLLLDGGKGALAVFLASYICPDYFLMIVCGFAAFIGHIFPIWLKLKGGKGVATGFGVMLILNSLVGFIALGIWALAYVALRVSALAALTSYSIIPFVTYFFTQDPRLTIFISLMSVLVVLKHKSNIQKLMSAKK